MKSEVKYAGLKKVESDINRRFKKEKSSQKSNDKKIKNNKIYYYAKLMQKMKINELVKEKRKSLKMTQTVLSSKTGIAVSTISEFEAGKHALGSDNLEKIMEVLKLRITEVISAAPYLLRACINIINQADICDYQTKDGLHKLLDNLAIKEIRMAIKKATE